MTSKLNRKEKIMKKILIVDDSALARTIHRRIVLGEGFEVVEAASGKEAIEVYKNERPDIMITDLLMPDIDGMEVAKQILGMDPAAKIIICSTDRQKYRRQDADAIGAKAFLTKPVNTDELKAVLEKVLGA
jgi:two-component system chemotaxis response regulator CheY